MKILKSLQYILGFAFLFAAFSSCKSTKDAPTSTPLVKKAISAKEQSDNKLENALLWKVSGNKIEKPSYVFGTIHIIGSDDFFYPKGTLSAFENTSEVYFEIDMDEMSDMSNAMGMLQHIFMDDNKTLKDLLTEEDYKMVNSHFTEMGLPMFMLERFKPMFLTIFASGDIDMGSMLGGNDGASKTKSYEFEFYELAQRMNKKVGGLETIEFQMGIFEKIPYEDQATMLVETIKAGNSDGDQFKEMVEMYKSQDINAMVALMEEDAGSMSEYDDVLLVERNKNWIPIMVELMSTNPTFFAVGAGHLGGKNGVIQLLRKEGYTLTPISHI